MTHPDCEGISPMLAPWADDALEPAERERVERHLVRCGGCRSDGMRQRAVRQALRERASALHECAPPALCARLQQALGQPAAAQPVRRRRLVWSLPVAASLVLGLGVAALIGSFVPSGTILATELALDHMKCRLLSKDESGVQPSTLEARWEARRGWMLHVPPGDHAAGLRLTGLRQCLFHGGTLAHLSYDYRGQRLSLFVLPGERQVVPSLEIMGMQSVSWTTDTHTYGLVGDVPREELARLAAYFKPEVMQ